MLSGFMQDIHESRDVRPGRLSCEWILCCEFHDVARGTDHDLAFERQLFGNRSAQSRFAYIFAHHKRADRSDVDDAEFRQLLRDSRRLASISSTDIHRTKKNDPGHPGNKSEETGIGKPEVKVERKQLLCALRVFCG